MTVLDPRIDSPATTPAGVSVTVCGVRAVLEDRVLDDATIVVRDGVIEHVGPVRDVPASAIDGRGLHCIAGLVDTHSDGLEKELRPRPNVLLPDDVALVSFEARARSAGVTTMFHGIAWENGAKYERSVEQARRLLAVIERRRTDPNRRLDHRVLHRLDVRDAEGLAALREHLPASVPDSARTPLVSAEDHTPGVGQYRDRSQYERYLAGTKGLDDEQAIAYVDAVAADRNARVDQIETALDWLGARAEAGLIRLMGHDPATPDEIDTAVDRSVAIAEFPTTVEAARRARQRGLRTVSGAPNVVRGGSHSGNVSAADLIGLGLCHGLASDYLPSTMLGAVGALVDDGVCALPAAVSLVTSGPADTVGLTDRGRLAVGKRGDLVLVDLDRRVPTVHLVVAADDTLVFASPTDGADRR